MDPYILECPHCHAMWDISEDDEMCHADDEADGIVSTCEECGGKYQLRTEIEVYFHAAPVATETS